MPYPRALYPSRSVAILVQLELSSSPTCSASSIVYRGLLSGVKAAIAWNWLLSTMQCWFICELVWWVIWDVCRLPLVSLQYFSLEGGGADLQATCKLCLILKIIYIVFVTQWANLNHDFWYSCFLKLHLPFFYVLLTVHLDISVK